MPLLRVDQLLSRFGYASRREAVAWVKAGRVAFSTANVRIAKVDQRVDPADILVDGQRVPFPHGLLVAFHKPLGYICSHNAAEGDLIYDLLPPAWMRRQPGPETVGRLDKDTSGLILITDDGTLVHRWTSPKHEMVKVYEAEVDSDFPEGIAGVFASGTLLLRSESKPCLPARLEIIGPRTARLELREGKYHQVRRMFASQGCTVVALHRTHVGDVSLGDLAPGAWRALAIGDALTHEDAS